MVESKARIPASSPDDAGSDLREAGDLAAGANSAYNTKWCRQKPFPRAIGFEPDMPTPAPAIRPQPKPTSPRIKKLLSRALTTPESLTPDEVRELAASVVYYLLTEKAGAPDAVPPTS